MDRKEAVELVKEMSSVCGIDLERSSLILVSEGSEGKEPRDVQLQIKMTELNFGSRNCLYALLDERKLKFKEQEDNLVIMQP